MACEIYTDVDGVYTTDPRIVPDARKMDAISYDEMLEMASMGAGVMHSRSIEFAKKFDVPLMVRNAKSDAIGTWIVPEAEWMSEIPACGVALAADEARLVLEGVPDRPGVSHRVFAALADANIAVDMIAQSVGERRQGDHRVHRTEHRTGPHEKATGPAGRGVGRDAERDRQGEQGVGGRGRDADAISGVAERMFDALAAEGVNLKMITTGDIKISVLVEEDGLIEPESSSGEPIKKAHLESKKAVRGRKALKAVHTAFALAKARKGAGEQPANGDFKPRPNPLMVAATKDREAAIARLDGMEDVMVSGVHLNTEQSRVTVHDLPDRPGNCSKVFNAVATGGILVDMIVQNHERPRRKRSCRSRCRRAT